MKLKIRCNFDVVKLLDHYFLLSLLFVGCTSVEPEKNTSISTEYATGFSIEKKDAYTIITINDIFPNSQKTFRYVLSSNKGKIPSNIVYDGFIKTPVKRIIATSTTHISYLEELNATATLVGFPETKYISSSTVRKRIANNEITDVGKSNQLNVERVLELNPDLILSFGVESIDNSLDRFNKMGIATVFIGEWNEHHPLGRAEWIKVLGALLQKSKLSDSIFKNIKVKYNEAKSLVSNLSHKPSVIAGSIYQDIWYLPGGKSYLAKLLQDANANYLWSDNLNKGSLGLSVESVLEKGQNADYWFAPGQHTSYSVLNEEHPLYSKFKATQNNKIFTYSKSVGVSGGVLFFESGACKPDVVLKDIIHHLYPEITKAYTPYYFLPLNE